MQPKYCLPIIKASFSEVQAEIDSHPVYAKFEIWLDYFNAEPKAVRELADKYREQLVFHFRRQKLEPVQTPLQRRLEVLDALAGSGAVFDLDISTQEPEFDHLKTKATDLAVIGSYHNYESTPPDAELQAVVARISAWHPAIVKLATYCNYDSDALRLLQLQLGLKSHQLKHVVLGMGPHGVATRVFGTLWGNELAFVPESPDQASAPGQLTRAELDAIFANLGV